MKKLFTFILLIFSTVATAKRELLELDKIDKFYNIKNTGVFYTPEIKRKDCNTLGMFFENSFKEATVDDIIQILKDYKTSKQAFWWANHSLSFLIKNYNIISRQNTCFAIIGKKENLIYLKFPIKL